MLIPWLEVNDGSQNELRNAIAGLRPLAGILGKAIVTTLPGREDIYGNLDVTAIEIIRGVKAASVLPTLADREGWVQIADFARQCDGTCVLEMETAVKRYWSGGVCPDWSALGLALKQWPQKTECWWYPLPYIPTELTGQARRACAAFNAKLSDTIQSAIERVRFVTLRYRYKHTDSPQWGPQHAAIATRFRLPPHSMLYGTYWDSPYTGGWSPPMMPAAHAALQRATKPQMEHAIYYPGATTWAWDCAALAATLSGGREVPE
jgi:hypothetical protein